jgi:hypothetical protein
MLLPRPWGAVEPPGDQIAQWKRGARQVRTYTHFRGETLEDVSRERLIEIVSDLVWESERRRQSLAEVYHTLSVQGKIDDESDLGKRVREEALK